MTTMINRKNTMNYLCDHSDVMAFIVVYKVFEYKNDYYL